MTNTEAIDREPIDIDNHTTPRRVRLIADGSLGGYDYDRDKTKKLLQPEGIYIMTRMDVGGFSTRIRLAEFPGEWFNSVQFEEVE